MLDLKTIYKNGRFAHKNRAISFPKFLLLENIDYIKNWQQVDIKKYHQTTINLNICIN